MSTVIIVFAKINFNFVSKQIHSAVEQPAYIFIYKLFKFEEDIISDRS